MNRRNFYVFIIVILFVFSSCAKKDKINEIQQIMRAEWVGKEILFPDDIFYTRYVKDTIWDFQSNGDYKVLIYIDSANCTSCRLGLSEWKKIIYEYNSVIDKNVTFLFFISSKNKREIRSYLNAENFDYPVCVDMKGALNKLNNFPQDHKYQVFLLDKDNKVKIIGNPILDFSMRDLYIESISKKGLALKDYTTTAKVENTIINIGKIKRLEKIKISLKNTGKNNLIIINVMTSCGCVVANYEKQPILPGSISDIKVDIIPKTQGLINENIEIRCNTKKIIKVKIIGEAI